MPACKRPTPEVIEYLSNVTFTEAEIRAAIEQGLAARREIEKRYAEMKRLEPRDFLIRSR